MKRRRQFLSQDRDDGGDSGPKRFKVLVGKVKKGSFEHRFERRRYLNQLAQEFRTTAFSECRQQVLANLANFAYDPYNYHFFQELGVVPIFMAELAVNRDPHLTEFAISGICNCAADSRIQKEILRIDGLTTLKQYLSSTSENILISLLTAFIFLSTNSEVKELIANDNSFTDRILNLTVHTDKRVQNVARVLQQFNI